jgi:hypothetical protein
MSILTLADLVSPANPTDVLTIELSIAQQLGLPTTAWQPLGMARTLLADESQVISGYSGVVNLIAQGGYASYAALMVDDSGNPITSWMDLILTNNFNVTRVPITFASGPVPVSNSSATSYPYSIGQLHFQNAATGATYSNTTAGTIASSGASTVQVAADQAWGGTIGTTGAGQTLVMLTPLPGVAPTAQVISLVGQNAESNAASLLRAQRKLGTLSALGQISGTTAPPNPAGPSSAYAFVATSIPQAAVASGVWPYAVVTPITRVTVVTAAGVVIVYIANAEGQPAAGDFDAVSAAIQFLCTPQAVTSLVVAASNLPIDIAYTVYVQAGGSTTTTQIKANISNALAEYLATVPIGGVSASAPNIVPLDALIATIMNANGGTVDLQMINPTTSRAISAGFVPVLGTVTPNVVLV